MRSSAAIAIVVSLLALIHTTGIAQTVEFAEIWEAAGRRKTPVTPKFLYTYSKEDCNWLCELLTPAEDDKPASEKLAWLAGSSIAFALFDYVGFNSVRTDKKKLSYYRVAQGLAQTGITYYLFKNVSLGTAAGFSLIWWTFGDDFVYFGFAELFNPGHPWESKGDFDWSILQNRCTWAYWTPIGIVRGVKRDKPIAGDTLIAQSLAGVALGITFAVSF